MLRLLLFQVDNSGLPTVQIGETLSPTVPLVGNTIQIMRQGQYTFWKVTAIVWNINLDDSEGTPRVIIALKHVP